jgi:hypothetical protein
VKKIRWGEEDEAVEVAGRWVARDWDLAANAAARSAAIPYRTRWVCPVTSRHARNAAAGWCGRKPTRR